MSSLLVVTTHCLIVINHCDEVHVSGVKMTIIRDKIVSVAWCVCEVRHSSSYWLGLIPVLSCAGHVVFALSCAPDDPRDGVNSVFSGLL